MAYTTEAKVKAMFRGLDVQATDTTITTSSMADFIAEADSVIDGALDRYYTTPITGVESLKIVGLVSKLKVSQLVKDILDMESTSDATSQEQGNSFGQRADALLKKLLPQYNRTAKRTDDAVLKLIDAAAKATTPESDSLFSSHSEGATALTPTFTKGGDNW